MKLIKRTIIAGLCWALAVAPAWSGDTTPARQILALTYPEGPSIGVKFAGTFRLPEASGEAKVERKKGTTEIEIELDEMKPAALFGGDFNTYVLWSASPEGEVSNLGEFILEGNRSKLNVSTNLSTFGLFVTAEPHFLVDSPSPLVVLENTRPAQRVGTPVNFAETSYKGTQREYRWERESLVNLPEASGTVRPHLPAAQTAVALARRSGAAVYSPSDLKEAREALQKAEATAQSGGDNNALMLASHEAIRLAVRAQKSAEERAFQEAMAQEREKSAEQLRLLSQQVSEAKSEAERAEAEARERELRLQIEKRAREQARQDAEQAAERAQDAERRAQLAAKDAQLAAKDAAAAHKDAAAARQDSAEARAKLRAALSEVASVRETARSLIVDLPDVLFEFGSASLRPEARETLSKVAGILLVSPVGGIRVEGHTDDIGSSDFNQDLSERRARAVGDFLVQAGLSSEMVQAQGWGESQPLVENDSPANRQKNRRVEIVVLDAPQPLDF